MSDFTVKNNRLELKVNVFDVKFYSFETINERFRECFKEKPYLDSI